MANIIKIGSTFINLDNVCDIDTTDDAVDIYLNVVGGWFGDGEGKSEQICRSFFGAEAAALCYYLESNAVDVMAEYESRQRVQAFKASIANLETMGRELGRVKAADPNAPAIWDYHDIKRRASNYTPEMDEHIGAAFGGALDTDDWTTAVSAWTQAFVEGWSEALAELVDTDTIAEQNAEYYAN